MPSSPFVPLALRTCFSMLSGASLPKEMLSRAAELGYRAAGLSEEGTLSGALAFYRAAKRFGLAAFPGALLRRQAGRLQLLARTTAGFALLRRAVSAFRLGEEEKLFSILDGSHEDDLAILCDIGAAEELRPRLAQDRGGLFGQGRGGLFGKARFGLLWEDPGDFRMRDYADAFRLPLVAAPPIDYARPEREAVHRALVAIREHSQSRRLKERPRLGAYLKPAAEYSEAFSARPDAVVRAREIAQGPGVCLPYRGFAMPEPKVPEGEGNADDYLARLCRDALAERCGRFPSAAARKRLASELKVIRESGYSGYFLIVREIVEFARSRGIPNLGRGSGANSFVSYLLRFTHVDPIAHDLYFERFLNPERASPPDVDLDFDTKRREEILEFIVERFGADRVARIGSFSTFSLRSALRDLAKVKGIAPVDVDAVIGKLPHVAVHDLPEIAGKMPKGVIPSLDREPWATLLPLAAAIDGFPRHMTLHCGGIVISPAGELSRHAPLERGTSREVMTQWDMHDVEAVGLVKIDILGNRSLGVLADVLEDLGAKGKPPDVVPPERTYGDPETRRLLREGKTVGCFYIESPAMRSLNRRLKTDTFEDLIAASSVIRPGVAESGMMEQYIARHLGREKPVYLLPEMEGLLSETHGVMIYQEDVLRVATEIAGLSHGEADALRRAMSGKSRSAGEMARVEEVFFAGCARKRIAELAARELWRQMRSFAGYSFCKAHSASYAQLSFQVAYLKAHHPAEFFAAVLNNGGGFYSTGAYVEEARRGGLSILPPSVEDPCRVARGGDGRLRLGFDYLRGASSRLAGSLAESLERDGPFGSLDRFWLRMRRFARPAEMERLAESGSLDAFGPRPEVFRRVRERVTGDLTPSSWTRNERILRERGAFGFAVSEHPLACYDERIRRSGIRLAADLERAADGRAAACGFVVARKRCVTSKGELMEFATLEDATGLSEITLFSRTYREFGGLLSSGRAVVAEGRLSNRDGSVSIDAQRLFLLADVLAVRHPMRRLFARAA